MVLDDDVTCADLSQQEWHPVPLRSELLSLGAKDGVSWEGHRRETRGESGEHTQQAQKTAQRSTGRTAR